MSDSSRAVYDLVRARLLTFTPLGGLLPLAETLGNPARPRLYTLQAPDKREEFTGDGGWPYAVLALTFGGSPGYGPLRQQVPLELMVYDYPRRFQWRASSLADVATAALAHWKVRVPNSTLLFTRYTDRLDVPPAPDPMDRELVVIRITCGVVVWPRHLTQYANRRVAL